MASTATVTGKIGAGSTATALVFSNVTSFAFDSAILSVNHDGNTVTQFDVHAATTVTCTKSGDNYTLTVSQLCLRNLQSSIA